MSYIEHFPLMDVLLLISSGSGVEIKMICPENAAL